MRRFITAFAFSFAVLASPAFADQITRSIPITQADLQSDVAVSALYDRVENAAKSLCAKANPTIYGYNGSALSARATCVRNSVDRAMINAGSPTLAAHHAQVLAARGPAARTKTLAAR